MAAQLNKDARSVFTSKTIRRRPSQTIDSHSYGETFSPPSTNLEEEAPRGLLQQFFAIARTLLPGQTATLTVTRVSISEPKRHDHERVATQLPGGVFAGDRNSSLARSLMIRLLRKAWEEGQLGDVYWGPSNYDPRTEELPDGTHFVPLMNTSTGFVHAWTICPTTLQPKHLGWMNR
ncbi:hypothetical protein [Agrobacterium sp. LAD9]|uniref:hypothetical protein n=1 Tax=Agrobacterium sp. LAD9 TaxID=2055153 RepID=UPI00128FE2B4|nr:hypothetical protein [Agrobacterium sp. LAD9]